MRGPEGTAPEERVPEAQEKPVLRSFQVRRLDPFLRWIFSLAGEAEIVSPPSAVEALRAMAAEVLARYEEGL
jgi:hypothetical protein